MNLFINMKVDKMLYEKHLTSCKKTPCIIDIKKDDFFT